MSTKRVFRTNNSGYMLCGGSPAPRTNAAGGDGEWTYYPGAKPEMIVNAADWDYYPGAKPEMHTNASDWVLWEDRNVGAAPTVNSNDEWQPYIKPEVL